MYAYTAIVDGNTVGMAELGAVDRKNGSATLCRMYVDEGSRGKGIAGEMIRHILKLGFDELKLRRIDLRVYSQNTSAIKCYEKCGFVKEACLREAAKFEDEYWDVMVYSMLRED